MELAIQKIAILALLAIGLSHILQHKVWAALFLDWKAKVEVGALYTGLLHFMFGLLVVGFHNVWTGIPAVLTILGWGWVLKGFLYLAYPKHGVKMLNRLQPERSWEFIIPGVIMVVYAIALTYHIFKQ